MYKIEFTLKQHTPLIHFQWEQEGATLRATEVKPKLDKYLDCFAFNFDFESIKKFIIGYNGENDTALRKKYENGAVALNYKVSIRTDPSKIEINDIPDKFPCFFGNMGEDNQQEPKKFSITSAPIVIKFTSIHSEIINQIGDQIPNFFARNNFGTRQSKGFGSFYLDEKDEHYVEPLLLSHFTLLSKVQNPIDIFKEIDMLHKVLRSGINDIGNGGVNTFYMKPLIWQYFKEKDINWDKRAIKKHFYDNELKDQIKKHQDQETLDWPITNNQENYKLVKDLLGLSSLEKWKIPYHLNITKSSERIERFKSPIFYKPIKIGKEFRIYIDADDIPEEFYNSTFRISNGRMNFNLTTPQIADFNIITFLMWAFTEVDIQECIATDFSYTHKAMRITKIFNELNNNANY